MKKLILFAAVLYLTAPPVALSAPKAQDAQECLMFADLALVASAAARASVEQTKTEAMLADIYELRTEARRTLMRLIVGVAYGSGKGVEPPIFAGTLGSTCMRSRGDMDSILGKGA